MPVLEVDAFFAQCDLCRNYLATPDPSNPNSHRPIALFLLSSEAKATARFAGWTVGRDALACPKCSPVKAPTAPGN